MWKDGVGDVRLRQPMALSVDLGNEGGVVPSSGDEDKPIRAVQPPRSFPTLYALAVLAAFTLLFAIVYGLDQWLPSSIPEEESDKYPDRFIGQRAHAYLTELTKFGVKTAGSPANDRDAAAWVENMLTQLSNTAHKSKRIEVDVQRITDSFHLAFSNGFTSVYDDLVNVVARLSDVQSNSTAAVLVNCHFDTVPTSPGGSDDGVNCAAMLEILHVLSNQEAPLTHSIVFLFNGAEENILQGSHGFITKHRWAKTIKAFVNLDSCGAGSREILFQSPVEHPWLLEAYADSAPHPHGFVIGEELFQSGIIPSDTDFRIFRDFGNLPGLDFAYYRNGYVYHTKYDDVDQIPLGTIQHTGDNILALLTNLANSPYLNSDHKHTGNRTVYWDLLGFKMVHYSQTSGMIVGLSVILLSVYTTVSTLLHLGPGMRRRELCFQGLKALIGPFLGWLMAFFWCILVALFLDSISATMSWYSEPLILIPLYGVPTFLFATLGLYLQYRITKLSPLCGEVRVQLYSLGVQLIWTVLLMTLTLVGSRSAYLLQFIVFFPSIASFVVLWFARPGYRIGTWLWLELGALLVPTALAVYHVVTLINLMVPLMGRFGATVNSELLIAMLTCCCALLCTSYLAPMVPLLRNPRRIFEILAVIHLIAVAYVMSPFSFPYSGNMPSPTPQRVYILQVDREFYNNQSLLFNDSGLWFLNMDRNSPSALVNNVPALADARVVSSDCNKDLICRLPLYSPRVLKQSPGTLWLPTTVVPTYNNKTELLFKRKYEVSPNMFRLEFEMKGPSHMGLVLCPFQNITLENWSLLPAEIIPTDYIGERPFYFVYIGREYRKVSQTWKISIDLKVRPKYLGSMIDIIAMGHGFDDYPMTDAMDKVLKSLPNWSHPTTWASSMQIHVF